MDTQEGQIQQEEAEVIELDDDFMKSLETDEITFSRQDANFSHKITLSYSTNAVEAINDRLHKIRYDPDRDIVKGVYEGGFTVWEGTYDLINYLLHNGEKLELNGKHVLDLGCGHGLVGVYLMKAYNDITVCFQDYNLDVLKFATVPNLVLNGFENSLSHCRFVSGDWTDFPRKIEEGVNEITFGKTVHFPKKFDAIFMAEVLYNPDNYKALCEVVANLLDEKGVCIVGSKVYYFGNGGSVDEFKDFIENNYSKMKCETLQEISDKVSNKREVFAIGINS